MTQSNDNSGYLLTLGNALAWRLSGDSDTEDWLRSLAVVLKLQPGDGVDCAQILFVRSSSRWSWARNPRTFLDRLSSSGGPNSDWKHRDFPLLRLWYQPNSSDVVCELSPSKSRVQDVLMMWYSMHGLYHGLALRCGFPLHSALVEKAGLGFLLIGNEGIGKSSCCRRLPDSWTALSDDSVMIAPGPGATYYAHPLPTWSALVNDGQNLAWDVRKSVPLGAAMFLERGDADELKPLGQGRGAVMMAASALYLCNTGGQKSGRQGEIELRKRLFLNACDTAASVNSFLLRVSPSGPFWEKMESVIGNL